MLLEKMQNRYRQRKSLALAMAFVVMISMLTMGAVSDKEAKSIMLIERDAFAGTETKRELVTRKVTLNDFLVEQEIVIEPGDVLSAEPVSVLWDNQTITIEKSKMIELHIDNQIEFKRAVRANVGEALENFNIGITPEDIVSPARDAAVYENMIITVDRMQTTEETVVTPIAYKGILKEDATQKVGYKKVEQYGVPGEKQEVFKITRKNGVEIARELVKSEITKEPIDEIVTSGTKQNQSVVSKKQGLAAAGKDFNNSANEAKAAASNKGFSYSRVLNVTATAYDPSPATNAGYSKTAYGLTPQYGVVAVDPRVIPLGTKLYIESSDGGASWVYGYCIAGDTGGAIKGNRVDLCYNTKAECVRFGRKSATVYVLD